jgi:hypothetical protein
VADLAGERYLRLLVERILATGAHDGDGPTRVRSAGAALGAVGAVDADVVEELCDDLDLALALRQPSPDARRLAARGPRRPAVADAATGGMPRAGDGTGVTAGLRAVATGPNRFETPEGVLVVESVSFGPDGATIVETLDTGHDDADPNPSRRRRRIPNWPFATDPLRSEAARRTRHQRGRGETGDHRSWGPGPRTTAPGVPPRQRPVGAGREQLRITDHHGNEYRRSPEGAGSGTDGWRWVSELRPIPDPATPWLEITVGAAPPSRLAVTPAAGVTIGRPHGRLAAASWLLGALQDTVASALRRGVAPATAAVVDGVDALLALGWILPSEPLLRQLSLLTAYPEGADELDPAIGSLLTGRDRPTTDRVTTLPLALLVDLGDRIARLDTATLDGGRLRLAGWFSPWPAGPGPQAASGWRITGFDDRHNHYVATVGDPLGTVTGAAVLWQLWPALDPGARSLRLRVAGPTREASVEIVVE